MTLAYGSADHPQEVIRRLVALFQAAPRPQDTTPLPTHGWLLEPADGTALRVRADTAPDGGPATRVDVVVPRCAAVAFGALLRSAGLALLEEP